MGVKESGRLKRRWSAATGDICDTGITELGVEKARDDAPPLPVDHDVWRNIVDSLASRVVLLDETGTIVAVNEAWRRFGEDAGAHVGRIGSSYVDVSEASGGPTASHAATALAQLANADCDLFELVYPCDRPHGREWFLMRAVPYGDNRRWIVITHQEVTEARLDHEQVLLQGAVLDEIGAAVHTTDIERNILTWNAAAERLYGWTAEEAIGRRTEDLMLGAVGVDPEIRSEISSGPWEGELLLRRKDGSTFPALARTSVSHDSDDGRSWIRCVVIDISERVRSERELKAARDHLRAVTDSIGEGMFTLDLDGRVTYMNPAAERTLGWDRAELEGKSLQDLVHSSHAGWAGGRIDGAGTTEPKWRDGDVIRVDDDTFMRADGTKLPVEYTSAPFATDQGIGGVVLVFRDISERKAQSRRLEREIATLKSVRQIQHALTHDRFVLYAQPIVDLSNGEVVQRELLIRMTDPDDPTAIISPGVFLPVAEEHGLIGDIDRWVVDQAAHLAATGMAVELNISGASIGDPQLLPYIEEAIRRSGADPQNMVFEITETTLVANESAGRQFVERLQEIGSKVALDDFGTGYGGFTYLKQLPVDYLKIDIEFVRDLASNDASQNVVEAIVTLAARFGLKTVAEGVEDEATVKILRDLGVDYAQGYGIGLPVPIPDRATADQLEVS